MLKQEHLKCDMTKDCLKLVTQIDSSGWIYCKEHGNKRKSVKQCRALKPWEIKLILNGKQVPKY